MWISAMLAKEEVTFMRDLELVRSHYTQIKKIPEPGTHTGNWCLGGVKILNPQCGYQTVEFCKIAIDEYKHPYSYCEQKD
jgi:hypothetical protein